MDTQHDVFISYAHADKTTANTICHFLEAEGVRCWIAPRDIPAGGDWPMHIPAAIETSRLMVLVFSDSANASDFVQKEVTLAANSKLPLIPFRVEAVSPKGGLRLHLVNTHWLDALTPPLAAHVRNLVGRVFEVLGRIPVGGGASGSGTAPSARKNRAAAAPPRREEPGWHYAEGDRAVGPVGLEALTTHITTETEVWRPGMDAWLPAGQVPELKGKLCPPRRKPVVSTGPQSDCPPGREREPVAGESRSFAGIEFCWCPSGKFMMGSGLEPAQVVRRYGGTEGFYGNTKPVHEVVFSRGFWMGKYEVTNEAFEAFVNATVYKTDAEKGGSGWGFNKSTGEWGDTKGLTWRAPGCWTPQPKEPVVLVSWNDAQAYVEWLNKQPDGGGFRLPSEAQWEYACRAGTATEFFWGNDTAGGKGYLNAAGGEGAPHGGAWSEHFDFNDGYPAVAPVGSFKPNSWGLHDMHGNVWEWCQDWYHNSYNGAPADGSAWESPVSDYRVLRGGSWFDLPGNCRAAYRDAGSQDNRDEDTGFRLLRTP